MRTWDVFFADVLPDVLGCPEPNVERALLKAAREFCQRTRCWRQDITLVTTGQQYEQMPYDRNTGPVQFVAATLGGHDIELEAMDATRASDRQAGTRGSKRLLTWDMRQIEVMPTPAAGLTLIVTALLQPSQDAKGVPDFIAEDYRDEIASGALAELLGANKAEWSNPALAQAKAQAFQSAIGTVQRRVWRAHTNRRPRVRGQFF